jgi:gamma-glutamylcyclotransferase (GGCT)/AIG2-like uncharacterized protein YtfP
VTEPASAGASPDQAPDRADSLPLFVYGSLRDPAVRASLLGERADLTMQPAALPGYARLLVPGFGYPFIVPAADARIDGEMILGLHASDYAVLDEYEDVSDDLYARVQVQLQTPEGACSAWAYIKGASGP